MKNIYLAQFTADLPPEFPYTEAIFSEKDLAEKYVSIERIKRELQSDELYVEKRKVIDNDFDL